MRKRKTKSQSVAEVRAKLNDTDMGVLNALAEFNAAEATRLRRAELRITLVTIALSVVALAALLTRGLM